MNGRGIMANQHLTHQVIVIIAVLCFHLAKKFSAATSTKFTCVSHRADYYISYSNKSSFRSCLECACTLSTTIKDLDAFGCGEGHRCCAVPKCVMLANSTTQFVRSRYHLHELYVHDISVTGQLGQKAASQLMSLAQGEYQV